MAKAKSRTNEGAGQTDLLAPYVEQIKGWKDEHGEVFAYITGDGKVGFFRTPTRAEVAHCETSGRGDYMKRDELLAGKCWLGGAPELLSDDRYWFGVQQHLAMLLNVVYGALVKL